MYHFVAITTPASSAHRRTLVTRAEAAIAGLLPGPEIARIEGESYTVSY